MTTTYTSRQHESTDDGATNEALHTVADRLTDHGFDITGPAWEQSYHMHLTNVRGALCEVDLNENGAVVWEYRPLYGTSITPSQIVDMVKSILGTSSANDHDLALKSCPDLTLKGMVGRSLAECGMGVCLKVIHQDDVNFEVYAEIEVSNPSQPTRGNVRVADDSTIRWECCLSSPSAGAEGMQPRDIAEIIARALAGRNT
jgi:hypothetical protein